VSVAHLRWSVASVRSVVLLAAALATGVMLGLRAAATAAPGAGAQSTTTMPSDPVVSPLNDPTANAQSPFCGDEDRSEPPTPPTPRCTEYALVPNLRFIRLLG
jgi:hypothetical protein